MTATDNRINAIFEIEAQIAALKQRLGDEKAHLKIDMRAKTMKEVEAAIEAARAAVAAPVPIVAMCSTCDTGFTAAELPADMLHDHGGGQPKAQIKMVAAGAQA